MATRVGKSFSYNADCDVCGFTFKNKDLKLRWDGFMVCKDDWETRNLADFYDTPNDTHILPWTRPASKVFGNEYRYRVNMGIQTEDFTATSAWVPNQATVTTQSIVNPNGVTQVCSKLVENVGAAVTAWINNPNMIAFNRSNAPWTNSIYVKPNGRTWIVAQQQSLDGTLSTVSFNLVGEGTVGSKTNVYWANISKEANGWYRISWAYNGGLGASPNSCSFYVADGDGDNTVVGDGVSGYYFWGWQQEQSMFPLISTAIPATLRTEPYTRRTPSTYQPVLDTTAIPAPYPPVVNTSYTWTPTLSGGTNQFGAGVIKVNTHYIIQNNVLTFWAEFQCEPGGYMRMNGNSMNLPVTSVVAGTWRIISSEGNLGIPPISIPLGVTGTIGAGASTFGTLTTGPAFFTNRLEAPVTLIITGSYGV